MSEDVTPGAESVPSPHPLASELASTLAGTPQPRLLLFGVGNGRNVPPFRAAGICVDAVEQDAERARICAERFAADGGVRVACAPYAGPHALEGEYSAGLSTNALLHGTLQTVALALAALRAHLRGGAPLFATFGSTRDPRFGHGRQFDDATFAPELGTEAGIAHAYFGRERLEAMLDGFTIVSASEASAAETVGGWAHDKNEAAPIVHWFVRARRDASRTERLG